MMEKLYKVLNIILNSFGISLIRNELRADLPSLMRRLHSAGVEIKTIYDIGAFQGKWTSAVMKYVPKDTNFFLFEPNQNFSRELRATGHPVFHVLLSDKKETKIFYRQEGSGDSYYPEKIVDSKKVHEVKMQTTTLDEMYLDRKNLLKKPDFVKIDTQGSELDILQGSKETFKDLKVIVLECPIVKYNQGAPSIQDYIDTLIRFNFVPFQVVEIHILNEIFVQIDIAFISKWIFTEHFGNIDSNGFWQSTSEFYGL